MSARLQIDALTKRWTADSGLPPVTFGVDEGRLTVVRGRSGSGKSTLIAIVAGLCTADSGTVSLNGVSLNGSAIDGNPVERVPTWNQVALVPQVLALAPELTVRENILDGAGADASARADELVEQLHLQHIAERTPDTCSMGEQQRTSLARALVAGAQVLLADEPTSHQDAAHRDMVVAALRAAADAGSAVLVVSHDARLWELADDVVTLGEELA